MVGPKDSHWFSECLGCMGMAGPSKDLRRFSGSLGGPAIAIESSQ
jgi:hypothetical protein